MEMLKILNAGGDELLSRDLAGESGSLLVIVSDGGVRLEAAAGREDRVIGAVVRTDDGWSVVTADPASPVMSGAGFAGDQPLVVGGAIVLAGFVFRMESDVATSGRVLLWRVTGGKVAAENVVEGRNTVAVDGISGRLTVNPAVVREQLCEFYPTADGIEVVVADGSRLSVGYAHVFACGGFEGMVLGADKAAAAMKSRNPFALAGRHVRRRILMALAGAVGVFFVAALINRAAVNAEARLSVPRGAQRIESQRFASAVPTYSGDAYVYLLSAYREMPLILGPRPSPAAADLVRRAESMKDDPEVCRMAAFLKQVSELQETVLANRWSELDAQLSKADLEMFTRADGNGFLADVRELAACANRTAPRLTYEITDLACTNREEIIAKSMKIIMELKDNIFYQTPEVRQAFARMMSRGELLDEFIEARARVLKDGTGIDELRTVFTRMRAELDEEAYDPVFKREIELMKGFVVRRAGEILADAGKTGVEQLASLCDLADDVGVSPDQSKVWREQARTAIRAIDLKCQSLYQQYRLTPASDPAADRILDELIAASPARGKFGSWARREKERRSKEAEGK